MKVRNDYQIHLIPKETTLKAKEIIETRKNEIIKILSEEPLSLTFGYILKCSLS